MIIKSLIDTDFYKLTMQQVVLHHCPGAMAEFKFKCRNKGVNLAKFVDEIRSEIQALASVSLTIMEAGYLRTIKVLTSDYIDFLESFRFNPKYVTVNAMENGEAGEIDITVKGPWLQTILYEIPVLAIVNEVYFRNTQPMATTGEGDRRLAEKIAMVKEMPDRDGFKFVDFGTRRRYTRTWQDHVVTRLRTELPGNFVGTSNVKLAMTHGLQPIGTMAHEYLQAAQALGPSLADFQKFALDVWSREYRGQLAIALSDVVGMDAFLRDFDLFFAKVYDGARHDSGDPIEWGEKLIAHYNALGLDAAGKQAVFSDGLTFPKAIEIYRHFAGRIKTSFGIGTNLTNDMGFTPLNIVVKMVSCNGRPVAKLSDSPGKVMCKDKAYLAYMREVFDLKG